MSKFQSKSFFSHQTDSENTDKRRLNVKGNKKKSHSQTKKKQNKVVRIIMRWIVFLLLLLSGLTALKWFLFSRGSLHAPCFQMVLQLQPQFLGVHHHEADASK
ncbi:hypothetical protein GOODEAATRI_033777 [Goodea atripinnis]|uniref:Uncharacterized protein n=1 Tax=Goodea atripinnis TaxID=208336 RepID=A0ABV0NHE5_9TELE